MTSEEKKEYNKKYYNENRDDLLKKQSDYQKTRQDLTKRKVNMKKYQDKTEYRECDWRYKKRYGISLEEYDDMLLSQDGQCANEECNFVISGKRLSVDHDHDTGEVRGLLCGKCNSALGYLMDDAKVVSGLKRYIEFHLEGRC